MTEKTELPHLLAPELAAKNWAARDSWGVFGIMSEFVEATDRLSAIRPAVSIFGSVCAAGSPRTSGPSSQAPASA